MKDLYCCVVTIIGHTWFFIRNSNTTQGYLKFWDLQVSQKSQQRDGKPSLKMGGTQEPSTKFYMAMLDRVDLHQSKLPVGKYEDHYCDQ